MKAKAQAPEKSEQPKPPLAPPIEQTEDEHSRFLKRMDEHSRLQARLAELKKEEGLAPWQKEIVALGNAYLSVNGEGDVLFRLHRRAIGLCTVVEDMALREDSDRGGGISAEALAVVMEVVQEQIQVAKWIAGGKNSSVFYW